MKKIGFFVSMFVPAILLAHGDHAPRVAKCGSVPCTKTQIEEAVPVSVELLSQKGRIAASWSTAKVEKVEQKEFKKGSEWVAVLHDEKQADKSKQRLYIFITLKGYLNGSNFTGE
jgi:hypothetical protein